MALITESDNEQFSLSDDNDSRNNEINIDIKDLDIEKLNFNKSLSKNKLAVELEKCSGVNSLLFTLIPLSKNELNLYHYVYRHKDSFETNDFLTNKGEEILSYIVKNFKEMLNKTQEKVLAQSIFRESFGDKLIDFVSKTQNKELMNQVVKFLYDIVELNEVNMMWVGTKFNQILDSPLVSSPQLAEFLERKILKANKETFTRYSFDQIEKIFKILNSKLKDYQKSSKEIANTHQNKAIFTKIGVFIKCLNIIYKSRSNFGSNAQNYLSLYLKQLDSGYINNKYLYFKLNKKL